MAKKKTPQAKLATALQKILKEYEEDVTENLDEVTKQFGKKGAQAVRGEAQGKGWGEYATGWTSRFDKERLFSKSTIYNKTPGLPHLLEHGHALRGGGRSSTRSFVHIAPVDEKISEEYLRAVKKKI